MRNQQADDDVLLSGASQTKEEARCDPVISDMLLSGASQTKEEARCDPVISNQQKRRLPLWLYMLVYVATAMLNPVLTDGIRYSGGAGHVGWPPTLLLNWVNSLSMASLIMLADGSVRRTLCSGYDSLRPILTVTFFDLTSGILITTGLLMLGGALYTVIYSSTTVWTALIARCSGEALSSGRWLGVLLVTAGMVLGALSNFSDVAGDAVATKTVVLGRYAWYRWNQTLPPTPCSLHPTFSSSFPPSNPCGAAWLPTSSPLTPTCCIVLPAWRERCSTRPCTSSPRLQSRIRASTCSCCAHASA